MFISLQLFLRNNWTISFITAGVISSIKISINGSKRLIS